MPPWPHAVIAAGDIVPPVLASDMAPLPLREDAALASIVRKTALQRAAPETTLARPGQSPRRRADAELRAPAARWGGPRAYSQSACPCERSRMRS
jgi:hypothetical protein